MRLAQLARKIGVKPSEIATFLASKNLPIEDSSNAKVSEDQMEKVLVHYAPDLMVPVVEVESQELFEEKTESVSDVNSIETPQEEQVASDLDEVVTVNEDTSEAEVIKPVLVELPGLKVVGKIDLPEPKKKEVENAKEEGTEGELDDKVNNERSRKRRNVNRENERRPRRNVVALQREREAREALRRKQQEKEIDKEQRTKRYLNKVKQNTPTPQRLKRNKHEDEYEVYTEVPEKPKNFIGKILNWFVSE
ncbi:MAG: hypothetical protein WAU36_05190 [Cyclobacteriaceae bacterium]